MVSIKPADVYEYLNSSFMKIKYCLVVFSVLTTLFLLGCTSGSPEIEIPEDIADLNQLLVYSADEPPVYSDVQFEPVAVYGDTDDFFFSFMNDIAVDDNGHVYISDSSEGIIRVFNSDGDYVQSIGGKGEGPGEFNNISHMLIRNNKIYGLDAMQRRITAFNLDDFSLAFSLNPGDGDTGMASMPGMFLPLNDGSFFQVFNSFHQNEDDNSNYEFKNVGAILDENGAVVQDSVFTPKPGSMLFIQSDEMIMVRSVPYQRQPSIAFGPHNTIYYGHTDRALFQVFNSEGEQLRAIYYDQPNLPLNRSELLDRFRDNEPVYDELRKQNLPETMPVFQDFIVDDEDRLWVRIENNDLETDQWWILGAEGEKIAEFSWPADKRIRYIKDNAMYTIEENELGVRETIKYTIEIS